MNTNTNTKDHILKNPRFYLSVALIIFFYFFASNVPYSHDDWQWGSHSNWLLMLDGFANYNGRYLGNLFEILITRNVFAKNIIMAIGMILVIWVVYKFIDCEVRSKDKTTIFILVSVLCLSMPRSLFRETYSWIAAFINFIPPVILMIFYLCITRNVFHDSHLSSPKLNYPIWTTLLMIPLGISTQLFSEHTTVYTVALAGFIIFYTFIRYKKFSMLHITYFVATIIGALIMFSNGAYSNAANNTDGYKEISISLLSIIDIYVNEMSNHLFLNNYLLNTLIAILCIVIVQKSIKHSRNIANTIVGNIQIFILSTYMFYSLINKLYPPWNIFTNTEKTAYFNALYSLLFFVCVLSIIIMYINGNGLKMKLFMVYGSVFAVAMPLIIANPIGARCFFASYILTIISAIHLLLYIINDSSFEANSLNMVLLSVLIMICVYYGSIFVDVGNAEYWRVKAIEEGVANGYETITLYRLPYEDYYWTTVPPDEHWASFFKEFYGIPQDVQLEFKWPEIE